MRKFSVLHLSDLHITKNHSTYPLICRKLIESIVKETKDIKSLILVVTGDIIDKADFESAEDIVVLFFKDLVNKLNGKVIKIYFTPGNHDKRRADCNPLFREYFNKKAFNSFNDEFEKNEFKNIFSHSFDNYIQLLNRISNELDVPIQSDLCYCDIFNVNNCCVRINCINSSLTSLDDHDKGSLHIGKFQIDKIEQDYEKIKRNKNLTDEDVDITLTIMHHPIFWLHKDEYDIVMNSISSFDSLSTDVLLRGHTHDRNLENNYSLYSSFSTLVTGIGKEDKEDKDHPQRYSIYTFMCDLNMIEIIMRSSSEKGFIPDYSAYVNQTDEKRKKIHFPMKVHDYFSDNQFKLPLVGKDFQPIFPTKYILDTMTDISNKLLLLKEGLDSSLFACKQDILYKVFEYDKFEFAEYDNDEEMKDKEQYECFKALESYLMNQGNIDEISNRESFILDFFERYKSDIKNVVKGFLYDTCRIFSEVFYDNSLKEDEKIRVQFRVFNAKTCSHDGLTNHSLEGKSITVGHHISPVKWGSGLIKSSFETESPMIYSFNNEYINDRMQETEWKEYITYAPSIASNLYNKRKKTYPVITFGINSTCKKDTMTFEVLSFLSLKPVIDDLLQNIHESFNFSFETLLKK